MNCLHEIFFDAALDDARKLDEYFAQHGKVVGPLHGVPVSLKDQFHVKGVDTSMGYVGWIGTFEGKKEDPRYRTHESELVRELRALGAILYCKTAVPHTLMSGETANNIIHYTWNPKNRFLSAGGSSGGEGALIALRGSPLGLGTDIGGSVRIPSAFNGLYGLRPSSGRIPYQGAANSMDGQNSILSVIGPMGTTLSAIRLMTKSILSQQPWLYDPMVVPMPWREHEDQAVRDRISGTDSRKLSFAVQHSDGLVTPHPPVARAIQRIVDAVQKAGHQVLEWEPPYHEKGIEITSHAWRYDGGKDAHEALALSGEPIVPNVAMTFGHEIKPELYASDLAKNNVAIREWKKAQLDAWNSTSSQTGTALPIDAIISPVAPFAAARPTRYIYYGYTMTINTLDLTSVVIPVLTADQDVDKPYTSFHKASDLDGEIQNDYDPALYHGTPVSIQLIGRRHDEEKMLAIAEYVAGLL